MCIRDRYTTNRAMFILNGVDGRVVEDLRDKIKRIDDIRYIWLQEEGTPLPALPAHANAATYRKFYTSTPDDSIFQVIPVETEGYVRVTYRTKPKPFTANDEVHLDDDLLVCATAFNYLADDEDAPNSCFLYTSDAADERSSVDLGGRRIIKKKKAY